MQEFARVARQIDHEPSPGDDEYSRKKWDEIEARVARGGGKALTGICYTLKVVKPVSIRLEGEFPKLGWCDLRLPNYGMKIK